MEHLMECSGALLALLKVCAVAAATDIGSKEKW